MRGRIKIGTPEMVKNLLAIDEIRESVDKLMKLNLTLIEQNNQMRYEINNLKKKPLRERLKDLLLLGYEPSKVDIPLKEKD